VGPRPRAFVVGEEALVRRCWGWGCASSLIVAEHACPCLWAGVLVGCGRRVASGAAPSRERAGSWTSDATAQRALRPGPGRRASCASAAQAGKLAGSSARAGAAPALRRRLACVQRLVRAILTAGSGSLLRAGCLLASDSARAVALIERLLSRRSAHPGRRSAFPRERTRRRARRQSRQPTARQRQPRPQGLERARPSAQPGSRGRTP